MKIIFNKAFDPTHCYSDKVKIDGLTYKIINTGISFSNNSTIFECEPLVVNKENPKISDFKIVVDKSIPDNEIRVGSIKIINIGEI